MKAVLALALASVLGLELELGPQHSVAKRWCSLQLVILENDFADEISTPVVDADLYVALVASASS